jgi:hypothetical protein
VAEQKNKKPTRSSFYVPSAAAKTPKTREICGKKVRAENVRKIEGTEICNERRTILYAKKVSREI